MTNSKSNKVVVINPETKMVTTQQVPNDGALKSWYAIIGNGCNLVATAANVPDFRRGIDNTLFCDDEILLRFDDIKGAWRMGDDQSIFFNTCIFSGCDETGETCDTTMNAELIQKNIVWLSKEEALEEAEKIMLEPIKIITFDS
jgi:hypothetical protein